MSRASEAVGLRGASGCDVADAEGEHAAMTQQETAAKTEIVYRGKRVCVVVPARDEALHIRATIESVPTFVDSIVVVDDGSVDNTGEFVRTKAQERAGITLLRHSRSLGVGATIGAGYRQAFSAIPAADLAVVMAGDGQMAAEDVPHLLDAVIDGGFDYVKGNRFHRPSLFGAGMPVARRVGGATLSALTRWSTGAEIDDSQCGFTVLTRSASERLDLVTLWPGYGYPNDMIALCAAAKLRVGEVPVRPVYRGEASGLRVHHALLVIPWVIARARWLRSSRAAHAGDTKAVDRDAPAPPAPLQSVHANRDPHHKLSNRRPLDRWVVRA